MDEQEVIKKIETTLYNTKEDLNNSESTTLSEQYIKDIQILLKLYYQKRQEIKSIKDKIQLVLFKHRYSSPSKIDLLYRDVSELLKEE